MWGIKRSITYGRIFCLQNFPEDRIGVFYPTDSCHNPLKDILIPTWADFSINRFDLPLGLEKKVSLNTSKVGDHPPFFVKLFKENLPYQMTDLNDLRICDTIINIDPLPSG
jgi:hypothetical protein